jgi:hypothetical protein
LAQVLGECMALIRSFPYSFKNGPVEWCFVTINLNCCNCHGHIAYHIQGSYTPILTCVTVCGLSESVIWKCIALMAGLWNNTTECYCRSTTKELDAWSLLAPPVHASVCMCIIWFHRHVVFWKMFVGVVERIIWKLLFGWVGLWQVSCCGSNIHMAVHNRKFIDQMDDWIFIIICFVYSYDLWHLSHCVFMQLWGH